jgi:hypothetical protein
VGQWEDGGKSGDNNMVSARMDTSAWCHGNVTALVLEYCADTKDVFLCLHCVEMAVQL